MAGTSEEDNEKFVDDSTPFGKTRKSTDLLCLIIFLLYWVGMVALFIVGVSKGDPRRLIYGYETNPSTGAIQCGTGERKGQEHTVYPRVEEDLLVQSSKIAEPNSIDFFGVCVDKCPKAGEYVCTLDGDQAVAAALSARSLEDTPANRAIVIDPCLTSFFQLECSDSTIQKNCFKTQFPTTSVFYRCLPEYGFQRDVSDPICVRYEFVERPTTGDTGAQQCSTGLDLVCVPSATEPECVTGAEVSCPRKDLSACGDGATVGCGSCQSQTTITTITETKPENSNVLFDSFNNVARVAQEPVHPPLSYLPPWIYPFLFGCSADTWPISNKRCQSSLSLELVGRS